MSTPPPEGATDQEIFLAELEEIRRRRELLGLDRTALTEDTPPLQRELRGLAFSGGGVRSACVMLGVAEAFAREGRLGGVDYLSTVSGGGYLGGALSSALGGASSASATDGEFPFRLGAGTAEPEPLSHLRSFSDFLAPEGALGRLRLAAVLVRGVVLNAFLFLPWILAAVVLTEISYEIEARLGWQDLAARLTVAIVGFALLLVFTFPFVVRLARGRFTWRGRNTYDMIFAGALATALAAVALLPFTLLTRSMVLESWTVIREAVLHRLERLDTVAVWSGVIALGVAWFTLRRRIRLIATITSLVGQGLLWLLGPTILIGAYLVFCVRFVHLPFAVVHVPGHYAVGVADSLSRGVLPGGIRQAVDRQLDQEGGHLSHLANVVQLEGSDQPWIRDSSWYPRSGPDWLFGATNGPQGHDNVALFPITVRKDSTGELEVSVKLRSYPERRDFLVLGLLVLLMLINGRIMDVNVTSLHQFYRDRLSRAYLLRRDAAAWVANDRQRLSELNPSGVAPYHLINATINVSGSANPLVRGRNADFFLFSKYYSGARCTGYCSTALMEQADPRLDLASAMAISGAAAGPRMGVQTVDSLAGDMTVFNLRLGYWLANPRRVATGSGNYSLRGPGPSYLLRESFGVLHERGRYVNVSDGGHIENLGVYELLRRRCRTIVAVDAAADPELTCDAMATLIRYARIDLGISITMDLAPLRRQTTGFSAVHAVVGTIQYGPGADETGQLVYLKASLTGDENVYLQAFAREHPDFPHQSTANQFFDEVEFEVYRALGDHLASTALADPGPVGRALEVFQPAGATGTA
jgi:hypothetical protein